MPIRVKSKPSQSHERDLSPISWKHEYAELPDIAEDDSFRDVIKKLSLSVNGRSHSDIASLIGPTGISPKSS